VRHPIHDILIRWLATEQYAFDGASREVWPPGCWPDDAADGGGGFDDNPQSSETAPRHPG
jgi:hypothetical protein